MKFRWYQIDAIKALIDFVLYQSNNQRHPIAVEPTGSGKTAIILGFIDEYLSINFNSKILVLSHVKEILEQNHKAICNYFDGMDIGLYSAGLDSKTIRKITVAGIQSVWRSPELFLDFDIVIIDECHLVTIDGEGMYRQFLSILDDSVYIGLTAIPFRLGHGYIHEGDGALFTDIVHDMSSMDNFNRLISEGFLSKLITKPTDLELTVEGVRTLGGDFNIKDLSNKFDRDEITQAAVNEIVFYGKNYNKWLIFAIDIDHAEHITECLISKGIKTACVHSKMSLDRDSVINDFKNDIYRAVVNVDILTTGFDVPSIDLIAQLRHTKSPVIHVESLGRGSRVIYADGYDLDTIDGRLDAIENSIKRHCLILDFAGNTERLGPINNVSVKKKGEKGTGKAITKRCPECTCIHHPSVKICDVCGYEFQFKHNLNITASNVAVVKEKIIGWVDVDDVKYSIHSPKNNGPESLLVTYICGYNRFKEWICLGHSGYTKYKAQNWVKFRLPDGESIPIDVADLYSKTDLLTIPIKIKVDTTDKWPRIIDSEF